MDKKNITICLGLNKRNTQMFVFMVYSAFPGSALRPNMILKLASYTYPIFTKISDFIISAND